MTHNISRLDLIAGALVLVATFLTVAFYTNILDDKLTLAEQRAQEFCDQENVKQAFVCHNIIGVTDNEQETLYYRAEGEPFQCLANAPDTMSPECKKVYDMQQEGRGCNDACSQDKVIILK